MTSVFSFGQNIKPSHCVFLLFINSDILSLSHCDLLFPSWKLFYWQRATVKALVLFSVVPKCAWMRQKKQLLGVVRNRARRSKGSRPCLRLWLSPYLNLSAQWRQDSREPAALMGKNKTACFPFLHLSSRRFLSPLSLSLRVPVWFGSLSVFFLRPPASRSTREPPPSASLSTGSAFSHHATINSGPAATNTCCF